MLDCLRRARETSGEQEAEKLGRPPFLLGYRTSTPFITLTVGLGILVDLSGYSLVVPVIPFRLEELGYTEVASKSGWLIAAYAAGLIVAAPPMAWIGSRLTGRRLPLIFALLFMMGALVLMMETASFTAMVISRVLQGVSGTAVWTLGLALITDSVPEHRVGSVMGVAMIGFSVGELIGPPVGGVLYDRMGYRAPFVFALCLVLADMVLRFLVVEKHVAIKYIKAGLVDIPGFEARGYTSPGAVEPEKANSTEGEDSPSSSRALLTMITSMRPLTLYALVILNGMVIGGLVDTGMTIYLEEFYGLSPLGAGLVFLGLVAPTFVASPIAGWVTDRYGAKTAAVGVAASIPLYPLLIIRGPLPLFIFFLVLIGCTVSSFLSPIAADLNAVVAATPGLPVTFAYAGFIAAFSVGSFVGPLFVGEALESLGTGKGWMAMCIVMSFITLLLLPLAVLFVGGRLRGWHWRPEVERSAVEAEKQ